MADKEEDSRSHSPRQDSLISSSGVRSVSSPSSLSPNNDAHSSSASSTGGGGGVKGNVGLGKKCVVCGDRALSCNFGAITCESCKAFFRRNALKEIWGKCDGNCPVAVETRTYCKKCRLEKCISVGMKKDLILNDNQKHERRQKILENRMRRQGLTAFAQNQFPGGSSNSSSYYPDDRDSPDGIDPRLGYVTRHMVEEVVMMPTHLPQGLGQVIPGAGGDMTANMTMAKLGALSLPSRVLGGAGLGAAAGSSGGGFCRDVVAAGSNSPQSRSPQSLQTSPSLPTAPPLRRSSYQSLTPSPSIHQGPMLSPTIDGVSVGAPPLKTYPQQAAFPTPNLVTPTSAAAAAAAAGSLASFHYHQHYHHHAIDVISHDPPLQDTSDALQPRNYSSTPSLKASSVSSASSSPSTIISHDTLNVSSPGALSLGSTGDKDKPSEALSIKPPVTVPVDTKPYVNPYFPQPYKMGEAKKIGLEATTGSSTATTTSIATVTCKTETVDVKVKEQSTTPPQSKECGGESSQSVTPPSPRSPKVSHSLSHVNMEDLLDKMEMPKLVLFLEVKKGFSITFDQPVDDPISPAPSYTDFFNLADLPIKRLVKLAKSLSPFHKLNQDDQISLLKGSVVAVVTIRSAKLFNPNQMGWNVTRGGQNMQLSSISLLTSNPDGARFFQQYIAFVSNLVRVSKSDDGIFMLLIILSVFDPTLDKVEERSLVQEIRQQYSDVLKQYIEIKYPDDEGMFDQVFAQLDCIAEVRNMHSQALQKTPPNKLEPLIKEIFDVSKYSKSKNS